MLTTTKIQIPGARSGLVPRTRLIELLNASAEAKLVLVQARVGYGTTTLLSEWHAATPGTRHFA